MAAHATQAGLSPGRADDLVIAVHELAANAVRHGAGHGRLRVWRADHALLCEISDDGTPLAADAAQRPSGESGESGETRNPAAQWRTEPGHGLSLVRQVADQASLISGRDGTLATISFALGPPEAQFRLDRQHRGGCTVVAVTGPLDLSSAGQLTETIDVLLAETPDLSLVLDLTALAGWDSVGLAALITAQQRISASPPARMILAGLPVAPEPSSDPGRPGRRLPPGRQRRRRGPHAHLSPAHLSPGPALTGPGACTAVRAPA